MKTPIRCLIGIHSWTTADQDLPIQAIFPFDPADHWERVCTRCGKEQKWLPGYGGSELGCWITYRPKRNP